MTDLRTLETIREELAIARKKASDLEHEIKKLEQGILERSPGAYLVFAGQCPGYRQHHGIIVVADSRVDNFATTENGITCRMSHDREKILILVHHFNEWIELSLDSGRSTELVLDEWRGSLKPIDRCREYKNERERQIDDMKPTYYLMGAFQPKMKEHAYSWYNFLKPNE